MMDDVLLQDWTLLLGNLTANQLAVSQFMDWTTHSLDDLQTIQFTELSLKESHLQPNANFTPNTSVSWQVIWSHQK